MASLLESMTQKITILPIYGIGGIGKTTFAKLIYNDTNFIYYSKIVGAYNEGVTLFTMHDLVHDLARLVMVDEILDASKQGTTGESSCIYALLTDCSKPLESSTSSHKISALRFLDCGKIELHGNAFSSAKSLRVLDLSECRIQNLPASIGELVQLRYLSARKIQSTMIPDHITKLSKLIYLNLSGSRMSALPEAVGEIKGLMHLDMSHCTWIEKLPESFVNLTNLVHLNLSYCRWLRGVSKALVGLTNIQYLNLSFIAHVEGLQDVIGNLIELRYLDLSGTISSIFGSAGSDLVLSFINHICGLSSLEHLYLSVNYSIVSLPGSIGSLRKLHTLDLSGCGQLMNLPECVVKMDSLKNLNVNGCSKLDRSSLFALLPHFVVHVDDKWHVNLDNMKSAEEVQSIMQSIKLIQNQVIQELELQWTRDARRCVEDVELLGVLVPPITLKRFKIEGYNSTRFPAWFMGISLYLPHLLEIELWDLCKCNKLPPLGQLRNLEELVIGGMESITTIEEGFCGGARAFPRLKKFRLCHMENLEVWNTMYSYRVDCVKEFVFTNIVELSISDCPKLRLKPCPPRAKVWQIENSNNVLSTCGDGGQTGPPSAVVTDVIVTVTSSKMPLNKWRLLRGLPNITTLSIKCCTDLTCSSPKIIRYLSAIKSLHLEDNAQPELPKWSGDLISLRELVITRWTELSDLQESMRHLTSLEHLYLSDCPNIPALPEWIGDLASLKKLEILYCRGIKSLPGSIQKLTNLEQLNIVCAELADWCELEENKTKLAHIKVKDIAKWENQAFWSLASSP